MAAPIRPTSVKAYGRDKWVYVPTVAVLTAPTAAEMTAGTGLDISCMIYDDSADPAKNTNRVTKPKRRCDTAVYEQIGDTTYTGGTMTAALDPQAAPASNGKKAWEKFPAGTVGFLVRRLGIAVATDLAAGAYVDIYPVEFDAPMPIKVGDGEAAEVGFSSEFAITGPPAFLSLVV